MKLKITALTAAMLCFVCYTNAQTIEKGSLLVNGAIGANNSRSNNNQTANLNEKSKDKSALFSLSFGKAIKNNLFIGVGLGYSPYKYIKEFE